MNEAQARQVLSVCQQHYNEQRPHQTRNQLPPDARQHPATVYAIDTRKVVRNRVLGRVINEYRYPA